MPLEVRRKPRAAEDIIEIWEYIAPDSLRSADKVVDGFEETFRKLAIHPDIGLKRPELGSELRSFAHGRFVIYFRHDRRILDIVRVLGAARKLSPALFDD